MALEPQRSSTEVKTQLEAKSASIRGRLNAIRSEFAPLAQISGDGAASEFSGASKETKLTFVALSAGFVFSLLFALRIRKKRKRHRRGVAAAKRISDEIIELAAARIAEGEGASDAMAEELARRVPHLDSVTLAEEPSRVRALLTSAAASSASYLASFLLGYVKEQLRKRRSNTEEEN